VTPGAASNVAPGADSPNQTVTFAPTASGAYPATLAIVTGDPVCTPLPPPIALSGSGTQGKVVVSEAALAFGTDPSDAKGLVDCGTAGPARTFTIGNLGNQAFRVTSLALGLGAASPYAVSAGGALPVNVPIGGAVAVSVTPAAIPASVPNPNDATPFTDTLTVTTDAALDAPHRVTLTMQARGAVVADTPLAPSWTFGTVGYGSIGTFTSTLRNDGNAPVSVALEGLAQPAVFGVQSSPVQAAGGGVTAIVGQFTPPASSGAWTDRGRSACAPWARCVLLCPRSGRGRRLRSRARPARAAP
jgi:hypothetical protein